MNTHNEFLAHKPVSTQTEMGAYEYLWQQPNTSTKRLAELFKDNPGMLPSELVDEEAA